MSFKLLKGQAALRLALTGELNRGTISHAVLFSGPPGSGKKTWGTALAQNLLCTARQDDEPCRICLSCRQFLSGNHPGFFPLAPAGRWIKIDQIREVRGRFYLEGGNRVCLIHNADRLTAQACSSLLKILEEPPAGLYFILLTGEPGRLFSTIISRCRCFTLHPLSTEEIVGILDRKGGLSPAKKVLAARLSNGLPGMALKFAEDELFEKRLHEAASLACGLAFKREPPHEILARAEALAEREDLVPLLELVCLFYRDGLIWLLCGRETLLLNPDHARFWTEVVTPGSLEQALDIIGTAIKEIVTTNVNRRLTVEAALIMLQRRFAQCQG